jgi:hypothetical protein
MSLATTRAVVVRDKDHAPIPRERRPHPTTGPRSAV